MGRKARPNEGYRGVREGDAGHEDAAVRAGEARRGSERGTERRLGPKLTGDGPGAGHEMTAGVGLDGRLRRRLAEVLSSAGVDAGRVAVEVLYLLPEEFLRGYEDLFHRAYATGEEGRGERDEREAELGRARGKAARKAKGSAPGGLVVRDDRAMGEKQRVDRALRKLARTMRDNAAAGTGKDQVAKCGENAGEGVGEERRGCGKWIETSWSWCPFCGSGQREELRSRRARTGKNGPTA